MCTSVLPFYYNNSLYNSLCDLRHYVYYSTPAYKLPFFFYKYSLYNILWDIKQCTYYSTCTNLKTHAHTHLIQQSMRYEAAHMLTFLSEHSAYNSLCDIKQCTYCRTCTNFFYKHCSYHSLWDKNRCTYYNTGNNYNIFLQLLLTQLFMK